MARLQYFKSSASIIVNESSEFFFLQVIKGIQYASLKAMNHTFHLSKEKFSRRIEGKKKKSRIEYFKGYEC